jgi:aminomethyltransferase
MFWKEWAGHYAVRSYDTCHEREYFALRHAAGLIDVSPLFKYEVRGHDAGAFLARVLVRDARKLRPGRVTYLCWCDDDGKILDDGTLSRLGDEHYRLTANGPALAWLERHVRGDRVTIEDATARIGALALQGPKSREILKRITDVDLDRLRFFRIASGTIDGTRVEISRTGYTGDLGYEIWVDRETALPIWDAVIAAGRDYRLEPAGLDAMDVTRIEAGFILNGVDYFDARQCPIESRKSTPYEVGLGRTVKLDRDRFVGQAALRDEKRRGSEWSLVGLEIDWDEYEALFDEFDLPPHVSSQAWRDAIPVFDAEGRQIGQATSGAWSPTLKKNLALASVSGPFCAVGARLQIEVTAEFQRRRVSAIVTRTPFFDPGRKRE